MFIGKTRVVIFGITVGIILIPFVLLGFFTRFIVHAFNSGWEKQEELISYIFRRK